MSNMRFSLLIAAIAIVALAVGGGAIWLSRGGPATTATAAGYGPGVSDSEIKIGNTNPYSGPASSYGTIGKALGAYWNMVNAAGGIDGRKIAFVSLDDGYNPAKAVEQARKLVESERVLATFQVLGTPTNSAIHEYMNRNKVPQLFVASGATKWGDPENFPWTMGWQPSYQTEGRIYAAYLLREKPEARIAILYQNDDYGRDYVKGLKDGLGARAAEMVVAEETYEVTDATVDSQIVNLKASGADTFYNVAIPKFAAQAIRKAHDIGWRPLHLLNSVSASIKATLEPAGLEKAEGIVSTVYLKDPSDPAWQDDPEYKEWLAFMDEWYPEGDKNSSFNVYAYAVGQTIERVLEMCGDELTRENLMRQAANLKGLRVKMLLPGILIDTSPTDFQPIEAMQMQRFDGRQWRRFGGVIGAEGA